VLAFLINGGSASAAASSSLLSVLSVITFYLFVVHPDEKRCNLNLDRVFDTALALRDR
jgi:hypothetical protein